MSSFRMALTQNPPVPASIELKRVNLASERGNTCPMDARLQLIEQSTETRQEAGNNSMLPTKIQERLRQ